MPKVNLKRDWFGPDASLHQVRDNPHTIPESWVDQLPSTAVIVEEPVAPKPAHKPVEKEK